MTWDQFIMFAMTGFAGSLGALIVVGIVAMAAVSFRR